MVSGPTALWFHLLGFPGAMVMAKQTAEMSGSSHWRTVILMDLWLLFAIGRGRVALQVLLGFQGHVGTSKTKMASKYLEKLLEKNLFFLA